MSFDIYWLTYKYFLLIKSLTYKHYIDINRSHNACVCEMKPT